MAVCLGQSMDHSIRSLLLPESCPDVYPTSLPPPSGARGNSVSLQGVTQSPRMALTVALVLIKYSTGGESTSSYTCAATELTYCALCVILCSSAVIALPVCVMSDV